MVNKDESFVKKNFISYIDHLIKNNRISHSYIIEVDNYDTDISYVYDFVKMILLNLSHDEILNSNDNTLRLIDDNNYPDIKVIEPDGSWIKKNQLLDLQKEYSNTSLLDGKRIYIIKNSEKLNVSAANTMLKFLEEPEDNIIAILLTDNRYHILDTIISRCQILTLKESSFEFIEDESFYNFTKCILKPLDYFTNYKYFYEEVIVDKNNFKSLLLNFENLVISFLNYKISDKINVNSDLYDLLSKVDEYKLLNYLDIIEKEIPFLEFNLNFKLYLDSFFSKLLIGG